MLFYAGCAANPLRIGYYNSCSEFHSLRDSGNSLNANFARLNHPAYINSQYLEYSANQYLEIKLARVASVHAIALQGSPNALRYYLKSFKVWYQIVKKSTVANQAPVTLQNFYMEDSTVKVNKWRRAMKVFLKSKFFRNCNKHRLSLHVVRLKLECREYFVLFAEKSFHFMVDISFLRLYQHAENR